jgi:ceramide glucosyltransferase
VELLQMVVTDCLAVLAAIGAAQALAGWFAVVRFTRRHRTATNQPPPPMSILKPLHGREPLLIEALATLCEQDYPAEFQIVFGVNSPSDPAIQVVQTLRARYPHRDIALVVNATPHGSNPKIGNLINMLPLARHAVLVLADADVHAQKDYLRRLADALARPRVGLVTVLYAGMPAFHSIVGLLGTAQITYGFLPGVLLGRALGRRDCLGATMCLRRETLARVGGLEALRDHLADDNMLGRHVRATGLDVALADTIVATTVTEREFTSLWRHEMRWARTTRSLAPAEFIFSALQYPLFWAFLSVLASGGANWTWGLIIGIWAVRAISVMGIESVMPELPGGVAFPSPVWLLPLRDVLSAAEWIASHGGRRVDWRGHTLEADIPPPLDVVSRRLTTKGSHA